MDLSITASQFGGGLLLLIILVFAAILLVRYMIGSKANKLSDKYKGTASSTMKKYPEANVFNLSSVFFRLGLVCSMVLTVLAFSWTTYEEKINTEDYTLELPDDIEMDQPRTSEPPPPPPPPPPPVIEAVPDDQVVDEAPKFKDQTVTNEVANTPAPQAQVEKPKPEVKAKPKPEPKKEVVEEIFQVVEQMPRFPGCEDVSSDEEKVQCAQKKLLEYIYKNIKYPTIARENGVEGTAVVSFVVEKDGSITDAKIIRDPGAGCGEEAMRVVNKMNELDTKWTPGKQRNENVRVQFNLPVRFRLE